MADPYEEMLRDYLAEQVAAGGGGGTPGSYLLGGGTPGFQIGDPRVPNIDLKQRIEPLDPVYQPGGPVGAEGFSAVDIRGQTPQYSQVAQQQQLMPAAPEWQRSYSGTTTQAIPTKAGMRAVDAAYGRVRQATSDMAKQVEKQSDLEQTMIEMNQEAYQDETTKYAKLRKEAEGKLDKQEAKILRLVEAQAKKSVDRDKWWSDRSAGQKFASVLGVVLGGIAEGITGGKVRNVGAQMIMQEIDRDIAVQKANIVKGQADIQAQQGILAALVRRGMSVERAEQAAKAGLITLAQMDLQAVEKSGAKTIAAYNAKITNAQLEANKAMAIMQMTAKRQSSTSTRTQVDPLARAIKQAQLARLQGMGGPTGKGKALGEAMSQLHSSIAPLENLALQQRDIGFIDKTVGKVLGAAGIGTAAGSAEAARNAMTMAYVKAYQGARASDRDLQMFEKLVPQTISTSKGRLKALKNMESIALQNFSESIGKAYGEGQVDLGTMKNLTERYQERVRATTNQIMAIYDR